MFGFRFGRRTRQQLLVVPDDFVVALHDERLKVKHG
jgi:hypothetical protein